MQTVAVFVSTRQCASRCASAFEEETAIVVNEATSHGGWAFQKPAEPGIRIRLSCHDLQLTPRQYLYDAAVGQ